ncbi:SipW-dependent-type signal peptide-containing protein [Saliphagus sp. LR7]|uniref:SipW-dependent-type signal peptide-containing protein n=1 Tax=Saliphagus sp. LR7 TaxID=2282654 RepID=UPI000DF7EB84|nr:SipW-dependent-type signal peptide-containing protein [Saliphagus sp. LR7]
MSEKDFEISRRKALAGLGVVGVASAGAGLGTTAYFSDEEPIDNNTITAGEFGLTVDPYNYKVDQDDESQHFDWNDDYNGEDDPGAFVGGSIGIGDAKPGDFYKFCWEITVEKNPGYVLVRAPSASINDVTGDNNPAADVNVNDLHDVESTGDLATLGETAAAEVKVYPPSSVQGNDPLSTVQYNTLNDLLDSLENGLVIASDDEDPLSIGPDEASYPHVIVCVYIWIGDKSEDKDEGITVDGSGIGNEIQGAKVSANLEFYAEQSRHNDNFGGD